MDQNSPSLDALFRTRPVALLDDLRKALHTSSRTTIFRVLSAAGYLTSYSHAGRYYTLKRIPKFDNRGIWIYRNVGFSAHGTLRATVTHLVESSEAGQTHNELQQVLHLRVHDTLRLLVQDRELSRKEFQQTYVYLSGKPEQARMQWNMRQQLAAAVTAELGPSQVIELLLDLVRHPTDDPADLSRRLRAAGHEVSPSQAEGVLERYGLKKTLRARLRRWKR
jgi:hypothetical protein